MSTEKLNTLERSLSETVHEVGVIYHQSLCKGLSVLAGDNSDYDSLFCDKVTMFVDEKAKYSQHFIEEMMSECKDDVKGTRDSLLGDILYEFNRGVHLTSEELLRVSRQEIHGYLDDLEDAYISKSDRVAAEFCRKLLERTWADFKQERDSQLCDHSEKKNCTEDVQNIAVKNNSTKEKLKKVWRGFKKLLCCCRWSNTHKNNPCENEKWNKNLQGCEPRKRFMALIKWKKNRCIIGYVIVCSSPKHTNARTHA